MQIKTDEEGVKTIPELYEWFRGTEAVEFEFSHADENGNIVQEFVQLGSFIEDAELSVNDYRAWTLDAEEAIRQYLAANEGAVFTHKFRVYFKERISPRQKLDGRIVVNGIVPNGMDYVNNIGTVYETWKWYPGLTEISDEGYVVTEREAMGIPTATIKAVPAEPSIQTMAYGPQNGVTVYAQEVTAPVNVEGVGFCYRLGNYSISKVLPGIFESGKLLITKEGKPLPKDPQGFISEKLIFSKQLVENPETQLGDVQVNIYGKEDPVIIEKETVRQNLVRDAETGNYYLDAALWNSDGEALSFVVTFDSFPKEIESAETNDTVYVALDGHTNVVERLEVTGVFKTDYDPVETNDGSVIDLNREVTSSAIMNVQTIDPVLKGHSFDGENKSEENHNEVRIKKVTIDKVETEVEVRNQETIHVLKVANKKENTGYEFTIGNRAPAASGMAKISIDLSSSVSDKASEGEEECVKGFDTQKLVISNFEKTAAISEIRIFDWNQDPENEEPKKVIPFGELLKDGTISGTEIVFDKETYFSEVARPKYIELALTNLYGKEAEAENPEELKIRLEGVADWFDDMNAKLTLTPENTSMANRIIDLTNCLHADRPGLTIHADLEYFNLKSKGKKEDAVKKQNTDGTEMALGIPYDRDFNFHVDLKNEYISVLDDVDVTVDLPVNSGSVSGGEAHAGFHTTKMTISRNLEELFEELESVTLYDIDSPQKGKSFLYNKETKEFVLAQDAEGGAGTVLPKDENGNIEVAEETLRSWGINYLGKVVITGKKFAARDENTSVENVPVIGMDFYGFSDSVFGHTDRIAVNAVNYLEGLRNHQAFHVKTVDHASALISKMYFDTTIVAGYKDYDSNNTYRFDKVSTSREHVRSHVAEYYSGYFSDNAELDVGYKSIGSYLVDFRQYLNVGTNKPVIYEGRGIYGRQEHQDWDYVYTQSLNTAANVVMNVKLPSEKFDAYYLKVHPWAKDYIKGITVTYKNGSKQDLTGDNWKWEGNSIETAGDEKYYRINLVPGQEEGSYVSYKEPGDYKAENPVVSVEVILDINGNAGSDGKAANPDFGTWFHAQEQSTKYMFEITGRFYKDGGQEASVTANMEVGGSERPGAQAKVRTQDGSSVKKSNWSYNNYYVYETGYTSRHEDLYDSGHLYSQATVYAYQENNYVYKFVRDGVYPEYEKLDAKFGSYQEFRVGMFRAMEGIKELQDSYIEKYGEKNNDHDYKTGLGSNWNHVDDFDWKGKHAFNDEIVLEDTLPAIGPHKKQDYDGFLTKDLYISPQLYPYIDHIEISTKKAVVQEEGNGYRNTGETSTQTYNKDSLITSVE